MVNDNNLINDRNIKYLVIMLIIILLYFVIEYLERSKRGDEMDGGENNLEGFASGRRGGKANLIDTTNQMLDNEQRKLFEIGDLKTEENKYLSRQSVRIIDRLIRNLSKKVY